MDPSGDRLTERAAMRIEGAGAPGIVRFLAAVAFAGVAAYFVWHGLTTVDTVRYPERDLFVGGILALLALRLLYRKGVDVDLRSRTLVYWRGLLSPALRSRESLAGASAVAIIEDPEATPDGSDLTTRLLQMALHVRPVPRSTGPTRVVCIAREGDYLRVAARQDAEEARTLAARIAALLDLPVEEKRIDDEADPPGPEGEAPAPRSTVNMPWQ